MTNAPEKKYKAGPVTATIWKNEATRKDGTKGEFYTIQLDRNYKDKEGNWKSTNSLRVNDLPRAVLVLNKSYEFLNFKQIGLPASAVDFDLDGVEEKV